MRRMMPGETQVRRDSFGMQEDGQIILFEGCLKCGKLRLTHSPIKIPHSEWEPNTESKLPSLTRWYDFVCFDCARAVFAPWYSVLAWFYRRRHGLKRMKLEDIKCPKINQT